MTEARHNMSRTRGRGLLADRRAGAARGVRIAIPRLCDIKWYIRAACDDRCSPLLPPCVRTGPGPGTSAPQNLRGASPMGSTQAGFGRVGVWVVWRMRPDFRPGGAGARRKRPPGALHPPERDRVMSVAANTYGNSKREKRGKTNSTPVGHTFATYFGSFLVYISGAGFAFFAFGLCFGRF